MKLKDYILEYVSSGRGKRYKKNVPITIDEDITLDEFIELIEELGYVEQTSVDMSMFEKGPSRYCIRIISGKTKDTRVLVKNCKISGYEYVRVCFEKEKLSGQEFVYIGNCNVVSEPTDLDSLEKYLTGL